MPFLSHDGYRIRYELDCPDRGPAYVLVNGLTQYAELWRCYRDELVARNFRVLTFDLLGQGESDKPSLYHRPARPGRGFESSRLIQAQIVFLKGPDLAPVREAVTAAVEQRHRQVRQAWETMLAGIGVQAESSEWQPRLPRRGALDTNQATRRAASPRFDRARILDPC